VKWKTAADRRQEDPIQKAVLERGGEDDSKFIPVGWKTRLGGVLKGGIGGTKRSD